MKVKQSFIIILGFVILLGISIQVTRINNFVEERGNDELLAVTSEEYESRKDNNDIPEEDIYLVVYDPALEDLSDIKNNVVRSLEYMKKSYRVIKAGDMSNRVIKNKNMILVLEDLDSLKNPEKIFKYVFDGGNIFFANRLSPVGYFGNISVKLGIEEYGKFINTNGIELLDNVLIKGKGEKIKGQQYMINSSVAVQLKDSCKKYAISDEGINLLWQSYYGTGKIFYFNGSMLGEKDNRGLIIGIISLMEEDFIYPIVNSKITIIEDFFSPISKGNDYMISQKYDRTIDSFYRNVWWPDMIKIATINNMKYTATATGTYDKKTENLNEDLDIDKDQFKDYSREILLSGGEIALGGYNKEPLVKDKIKEEYVPWKSTESMEESINILMKYIQRELKNYQVRTYVPPYGIVDDNGIDAIKAENKTFRILMTDYEKENKYNTYPQELEISSDGIITMPKIIYGYERMEENMWKAMNSITAYGYICHSINLNEIISIGNEKNKDWEAINKEFNNFQNNIYMNYQWLNGVTCTQGANELIRYLKTEVSYRKTKDGINIHIDGFKENMTFILRSQKKIADYAGCKVENIDEGVYLILAEKSDSTLRMER